MGLDVGWLNSIARAQVGHEGLRRGHLAGRRGLLVQVSHEADADSVLVDLRALRIAAVDAVLLVDPPLGNLDLAVVRARSVADHFCGRVALADGACIQPEQSAEITIRCAADGAAGVRQRDRAEAAADQPADDAVVARAGYG